MHRVQAVNTPVLKIVEPRRTYLSERTTSFYGRCGDRVRRERNTAGQRYCPEFVSDGCC